MPSRGLIDRQRISQSIVETTRTHAREVGERLNESLLFTAEEGEVFPDFIAFQHQLARLLEARLAEAEDADHAHLQELHDDREPRARRELAVQALYGKLIEVRELAKGFFGTDLANALVGIDGATAQDPLILHGQGVAALKRLRAPEPDLPPLRLASVSFDRDAVAEELEPFVEELGSILQTLKREERERESTKARRDRAFREVEIVSRAIGRIQIGLDELAGFPEFAERIRLSLPARGGRISDEEEDEELPDGPTPPPNLPDSEVTQAVGFGRPDETIPSREEPRRNAEPA